MIRGCVTLGRHSGSRFFSTPKKILEENFNSSEYGCLKVCLYAYDCSHTVVDLLYSMSPCDHVVMWPCSNLPTNHCDTWRGRSWRVSTCDHVVMWPCSNFTIYQSDTWRDCPRNSSGVVRECLECLHFKKWNNISFKINFSEYGRVNVCLCVHKSAVPKFFN